MGQRTRSTITAGLKAAESREHIARLYLQGMSQIKIAAEVGLAQQTVSKHLKKMRQQWLDSAQVDFDQAQAEQLAKLDALEAEYYQLFQDSKKDRVEKYRDGESMKNSKKRVSVRTISQYGDPRCLKGVHDCIAKRCEILGLNAPRKIAATTPDGKELTGLGVAGLLAEAERLIAEEAESTRSQELGKSGERRH